ncbi:MAG: hypothetical protein KDD70_16735, partial [Bdellovibrionales bacterium]|nr:hypothetical protein [Bdellovibrionales bacterium]
RFAVGVLGGLPLNIQRMLVSEILRVVAKFLKRHRNIAHKNLALVYPESSREEKDRIFVESFCGMGDLIVDVARFPTLDAEWATSHVDCPGFTRLREAKNAEPDRGILLVTGHLGCFELSAYSMPFLYRPISFIVRTFTNPYLDSWWRKRREANGNTVVSREGGYREMVRLLSEGVDVGILFDQNVTRNHSLFVDWFGRPAATTKALSLAALRTEAPLFVVALIRTGNDHYFYECKECDCTDLYTNKNLSKPEKLKQITERLVKEWEGLILKYPECWFWIHRRWKTAPEGHDETFYFGC